ncbi:hypothetical protein GW915_08370 [bacterium]|nr:hypothetical protein [bacterium]
MGRKTAICEPSPKTEEDVSPVWGKSESLGKPKPELWLESFFLEHFSIITNRSGTCDIANEFTEFVPLKG